MSDITIKIHRGTGRLTGETLCRSCQHGMVAEGRKGTKMWCLLYGEKDPITEDVFDCNRYHNRALPGLYEFETIAWTLGTDAKTKKIGFKPPDKERD